MVPTNFLMVILSLASDCTRIIHRPSSGFGYSYRPVYNSPGDFLRMHLRVMTEQDIPVGLRLNTLSGWNQTAVDWHRFLDNSPGGCFVMEHDSKVVGTATTISYENRFAWIGMVLVDPEYRKQGIGTELLRKTIEYLDQLHIPTVKLDATPLGKPLYQKLGFVPEFEIERLVLKRPSEAASTALRLTRTHVGKVEMEPVVRIDREVFGANRGFLLHSLFREAPELALSVREDGPPQAYAFGRRGAFADHLGPWTATSRESAEELLRGFLARSSRETLIVDCVKSNVVACELLSACGFAPSRPLTRMTRGPNTFPGSPDLMWAILGPEFG
jgi:GNAT superfamily N-acetyltransferase